MNDSAAATPADPVSQAARIDAIDVLRGFALLGIVAVNIQYFAMPDVAYFNPTAYGDLQGDQPPGLHLEPGCWRIRSS